MADSPFFITEDKANESLAAAAEGGDAEPVPDTSIYYYKHNLYSKL